MSSHLQPSIGIHVVFASVEMHSPRTQHKCNLLPLRRKELRTSRGHSSTAMAQQQPSTASNLTAYCTMHSGFAASGLGKLKQLPLLLSILLLLHLPLAATEQLFSINILRMTFSAHSHATFCRVHTPSLHPAAACAYFRSLCCLQHAPPPGHLLTRSHRLPGHAVRPPLLGHGEFPTSAAPRVQI